MGDILNFISSNSEIIQVVIICLLGVISTSIVLWLYSRTYWR